MTLRVMGVVMGVLNVTPDSFSDGGRYLSRDAAIRRALEMIDQGAAIIDVGGESTRPGAEPVSPEEERRRVVPVIETLRAEPAAASTSISVDTRHESVARAAVAAGASIINDVSSSLWQVAADTGAGWIAMHMAGDPRTMQLDPRYDDVVDEVTSFLVTRAEQARRAGVADVWIDPGIGFGKSVDHNLALLASIDRLVATGWPVVVGISRKATTGLLTARSDARIGGRAPSDRSLAPTPPDDRLEASLAAATWAMTQGVAVVRAHDVRAHVHAAAVVGSRIPERAGAA